MNILKNGEQKAGRLSLSSLAFLLVFLVITPGSVFIQGGIDNEVQKVKIRKLVEKFYDKQWFSGTVLVAEGDTTISRESCGEACLQLDTMNKLDTKFMVGSNTKEFTALLIMQLVEKGRIRLDGTISEYLPYYTSPVGKKVTVRHLLGMTSGLPDYGGNLGTEEYYQIRMHPWTIKEFVIKFCMPETLNYNPGEKFEYTNTNYYILGAIIEATTDMDYPSFLTDNILRKADMKDTGAYKYMTIYPQMAYGYLIGKYPAVESEMVTSPFKQPNSAFSAGYLYSTVTDFLKWSQVLYTDKLLSQKWRDEMFKPHILARSAMEEYHMKCLYFGYGWFIQYIDPETRQPAESCYCPENPGDIEKKLIPTYYFAGRYYGYISCFIRIPSIPKYEIFPAREKVSIIVFSNLDNFSTDAPNVLTLAAKIRDILFHLDVKDSIFDKLKTPIIKHMK